MANNPKPWRVSLILKIAFGGWTFTQCTVMTKFSRFKDVEYGTLFKLLDSYIPLVLSIYSTSFKLNNFSEYLRVPVRKNQTNLKIQTIVVSFSFPTTLSSPLIKRFPFISLPKWLVPILFKCGRSLSPVYLDKLEENTETIT